MIHSSGDIRHSPPAQRTPVKGVSEDVDRLIWNYLDGSISEGKTKVLNGILERSKPARQAYVSAVETHFGIADMFRVNR